MSTEKQIEANRQNAQKSTGPRTPEGKAKVSQNALTHGLTAKQPVLDTENPEEYTLFCEDFFRHHAPVGILEVSLAQRAADTFWRLQRAQTYETAVLNHLIESTQDSDSSQTSQIENRKSSIENPQSLLGQVLLDDFRKNHILEKILKYEMSIERSYFRTVKELRRLQSLRLNSADQISSTVVNKLNSSLDSGLSSLDLSLKNKPKIPNPASKTQVQLDPRFVELAGRLYDEGRANQFGTDLITKIEAQKLHSRQPAKKAM